MVLEWFVIGNAPWTNPEAIQTGQFLFHASYPIAGRLFDPAWFGPRQRRVVIAGLAGFSVVCAAGYLIATPDLQVAFFILVPLGFYALLSGVVLLNRPRETV
jgi:hypothetical protein